MCVCVCVFAHERGESIHASLMCAVCEENSRAGKELGGDVPNN